MSQQFDASPGLHLPEPTLNAPAPSNEMSAVAPERQEVHEIIGQPEALPVAPVAPVAASPQPVAVQPITPPPVAPTVAQPAQAADEKDHDAIDEEWINKAKAVVAELHTDPFRESQALNQVRTDYLKARHNKELKTSY